MATKTPSHTPNLVNADYTDLDFWKEITATQLIPEGNNLTEFRFGGLRRDGGA